MSGCGPVVGKLGIDGLHGTNLLACCIRYASFPTQEVTGCECQFASSSMYRANVLSAGSLLFSGNARTKSVMELTCTRPKRNRISYSNDRHVQNPLHRTGSLPHQGNACLVIWRHWAADRKYAQCHAITFRSLAAWCVTRALAEHRSTLVGSAFCS